MKGLKTWVRRGLERSIGPAATHRLIRTYRVGQGARSYRSTELGRRSRARLAGLRDTYSDGRCFIIGNGPSLASTDLARLRNEVTFGLNRGYLYFERLGGPTTFLVSVNRHVINQFGDEIVAARSLKFLSWDSRDLIFPASDVVFVRDQIGPRFCEDPSTEGVWEGATVTYVALQLAFHMGFAEAVLIGVDHAFVAQGEPHSVVFAEGPDPDHFDPAYFGKGVQWQLPDLTTSEVAYRLARDHFERAGRRVVDATIGGRLTVFPKVDFEQVTEASAST